MDIDDIKNKLKNIIRIPLVSNEYSSQNSEHFSAGISVVSEDNSKMEDGHADNKDDIIGINKVRYSITQNDYGLSGHILTINNYLSQNETHIVKFFEVNRTDKHFIHNFNNLSNGLTQSEYKGLDDDFNKDKMNYGEKLRIICQSLVEIENRIKDNNQKLNEELYRLVNPYIKILYEFYKLKVNMGNLTLFLEDYSKNNNIEKILILNKIVNSLIKKERIREVLSYIMNMRELRDTQSSIQKLLNNKEYIEAVDIIEETLNTLNDTETSYKNVKSLCSLSVRFCEINSIIEKLSLEDFSNIVLNLLKINVNVTFECIDSCINDINDAFLEFINNTNKKNTQDTILDEFHKYLGFYIKRCHLNDNLYTEYTHNSLIYPIAILLRKQRINFAVDDLELQINDYIDNNNYNTITVIDDKIREMNENGEMVSNKKIELLFLHYVVNIMYKLICVFTAVIMINKVLLRNNRLYMETTNENKSYKNVYLPIIQLLEQVTLKIFSSVINAFNQMDCKNIEFDIVLKHSHLYYWTCLKYILVMVEIENIFNDNIVKQNNYGISIDKNKKINFIEKGCIDLRIPIYSYYKELFDNNVFNKAWIELSNAIEYEKWDRSNLNEEYKRTFKLFINGELYSKDSVCVSDYFIIYNNTEYTLPSCCLHSIRSTAMLLSYIKKNPIIFYYGIIKVLQFVLNYNLKCYSIVINSENKSATKLIKITIYNIILCIQNTYFWIDCLEKIINYQLELLNSRSFICDKFVKDKISILNSTSNLGILLGIDLPSDYYANINLELNNVKIKLKNLGKNSINKISDVFICKFKLHVNKWMETNIKLDKYTISGEETKLLLKKHKINAEIELIIKDFTNLMKTLNKYMKIDSNLNLNIINNINEECINIWKTCLSSSKGMSLNYQNILFDLYHLHDKLNNAGLTSSMVGELYCFFKKYDFQADLDHSNKLIEIFQLIGEQYE